MKLFAFAAALISCVPAFADTTKSDLPNSPPAVTYDVWGFRWDGRQYLKQDTHSLSTSNLQQAVQYAAELTRFAGWAATTNLPGACVVHTRYRGPAITWSQPSAYPAKLIYSVWAFKRVGDQWVKDEGYCWTTPDPVQGLEYAKKVNAVTGWTTTTNCPEAVSPEQRYVDGGIVTDAERYRGCPLGVCEASYEPTGRLHRRRELTIQFGGMLIRVPYDRIEQSSSSGTAPVIDNSPTYDNSADIQAMHNTQDMINTQNMINNIQQMNNIQDMINTQNMVNSMQANP